MARNFARMVASGAAAHTDHGMSMLDLFKEVVNGNIPDYKIKDTIKLEAVAKSLDIEVEGRATKEIAMDVGLNYAYVGNVPGHIAESTYCPKCKKTVIWRRGYSILEINLDSQGICKCCSNPVAGVWS